MGIIDKNEIIINKFKMNNKSKIKPGNIFILLAGRHRGKRVLFLRNFASRVLIVGPYKLNAVPTRQVNPSYLVATAFKLDLSGIDITGVTDAVSRVGNDN